MEFAAVAQKMSQEHLQSLLASRGWWNNAMLIQAYWNPVREGTTVTDDRPEDTTATGGVVVGAVVNCET